MTATKIISVWLDETSDDHAWIVDNDTSEGGESATIKVFPPTAAGKKKAVAFGEKIAAKRGLALVVKG